MILNVFKKSYNKWRLEDSGAASNKGQVKIQAICVRPRELMITSMNYVTVHAEINS